MFAEDDVVPVRIAYSETVNKHLARAADGRWHPEVRLWFIQYGRIKGTPLEKHIPSAAVVSVPLTLHCPAAPHHRWARRKNKT